MDRDIAVAPLVQRIWARRRSIFVLVTVASLATGVVAFLLPPWYRAQAELLPPSEEDSGVGISSLLRGIAVPGVRIPTQVTPTDVFMVILESRRINGEVVGRFDLKRLYKKKFLEDALKELKTHVRFKLTPAGSIQISVEDLSPQRAADMANAYVEFLDRFNRETRTSKGRRTRVFIEGRLAETKTELQAAEQRLAAYQVKNKAIALSPQVSSAVDQAAKLYARRMTLEVRLGVIRTYSEGSEEEIQIRQELAQIDQQMRELPTTGLELTRLLRDVKALEQVFIVLTSQYEDARITEARDVVTVDVLDPASKPERKARPKRILMIAGAFLFSLALGSGLALRRREESDEPLMRRVAAE